jgi:23S rRNA pseudouridine1911/1915/1917 synthase
MNTRVIKIYEDNNLMVISKPPGLVVHPGAGQHETTLVDWLKKQEPNIVNFQWPDPARLGIVHRLDKDTSGLLVLAKNPQTLIQLQNLFKNHQVRKTYLALVFGKLDPPKGEIESIIGRDPHARRRQISRNIFFDIEPGKKRRAKTNYQVLKEYNYHGQTLSLIEASLKTGRMHQIRVHFKFIGHPIIGDPIYNIKASRKISKKLGLKRQFLHASRLEFNNLKFENKLTEDLKDILNNLEER